MFKWLKNRKSSESRPKSQKSDENLLSEKEVVTNLGGTVQLVDKLKGRDPRLSLHKFLWEYEFCIHPINMFIRPTLTRTNDFIRNTTSPANFSLSDLDSVKKHLKQFLKIFNRFK
ncbi:MAG: hypothetical protein JSS53_09670 [Proteobacteria bacterium]|nr:hypothetical protein [Pseudomonadota bacterium]